MMIIIISILQPNVLLGLVLQMFISIEVNILYGSHFVFIYPQFVIFCIFKLKRNILSIKFRIAQNISLHKQLRK
jgi:hypothetical protein